MAQRRVRRPQENKYGTLMVVILIPLLTFVGGVVTTGFTMYEQVATKPYVDDKYKDLIKFTENSSAQVLKEAYEHSDTNRRDMMFKTEQMINELKVRNAIVDTKLETLLKATSEIKDWTETSTPNPRRK